MDESRSIPQSEREPERVRSLVDEVDPVLVDLAMAVEELRLPAYCDVLAGVLSITDRLTALTSTLIGEVAAANLFELDGAASMAGWLKTAGP